ncbi:MAG: hypothetical protein ACN6NV_08415 [Acinetobacter gandensis]|uniref:hypothetical protein n=1 Tax=Acinetobacter gandensis TaxID=1443941 RepID=UPI003D05F19F
MSNVQLNWTQSSFVDEFIIERRIDEEWEQIARTQNLYYFDTDIEEDMDYEYRVGAVRGQQTLYSAIVSVSTHTIVVNDPFWANVELLLCADATSYPTSTYVDQSSKQRMLDPNNKAQIVEPNLSVPPYVDLGNFLIDGLTGKSIGSYSSITIGTGDFTAEIYHYLPSSGAPSPWYCRWFDFNSLMLISTTAYNNVELGGASYTVNWPGDRWFHLCLMRKNGVLYLFIDGNLVISKANTTNLNSTVKFGGGGVSNRSLHGYSNCFRLTSIARYAETGFTPPAEKFPNS